MNSDDGKEFVSVWRFLEQNGVQLHKSRKEEFAKNARYRGAIHIYVSSSTTFKFTFQYVNTYVLAQLPAPVSPKNLPE